MSEHDNQAALFTWARTMTPAEPRLRWLHAIPNGSKLPWSRNSKGQRFSREAMRLKAEGLTPGVWDWFLPVGKPKGALAETGVWCGAYGEMKFGSNKLSPEQADFRAALEHEFMFLGVFYTWVDAAKSICCYLNRSDLAP